MSESVTIGYTYIKDGNVISRQACLNLDSQESVRQGLAKWSESIYPEFKVIVRDVLVESNSQRKGGQNGL